MELVINRKLTFNMKEMNMELVMKRKLTFLIIHSMIRFGKKAFLINI